MTIQSIDQLKNNVELNFPPKRIISLVPSQTEYLFDLGLEEEIVGVTKFCIYPQSKVNQKAKIGGTKKFSIETIKSLNPDLIIGNKEENYEEGIYTLSGFFPVWISDIYNPQGAIEMMTEVSRITNKESQGKQITTQIEGCIAFQKSMAKSDKSVAYFIWRNPYMVAAGNTFIDSMLQLLGLRNIFSDKNRYPSLTPEVMRSEQPDFVFLSSEPYSFSEKHFSEFKEFYPNSRIVLVNGEMFSWYGSRLKYVSYYFNQLRKELHL